VTAPHRTGPPEVSRNGADRHQKLPEPMVMGSLWYYGTGAFINPYRRTTGSVDIGSLPDR
jgi:hypothetical protein